MENLSNVDRRVEKMHKVVDLVKTEERDLDLITEWESREPNVIAWSREKHLEIINNPEFLHYIVNKISEEGLLPVGYAILKRDSPDQASTEFIRLVISDEYKRRGYGVWAFENIWEKVFTQLEKERIWHDVFVENEVAIKLYDRLGYRRFKTDIDPETGRGLIFYEMTKEEYLDRG